MPAPATTSRLDEILEYTRALVGLHKAQTDLNFLERAAAAHTPRGFVRKLREKSPLAVIAEIKQASPSKGVIRTDVAQDAPIIARELVAAGAAALSIVTEEKWFLGSLKNLKAASDATASTHTPCLRKDFAVDEFQILEARASKADAVLLIAAALDDDALRALATAARQRDLDILCEVHNAEELDRVLAFEPSVLDPAHTAIGINSRDLHSFAVSLDDAAKLASCIPKNSGHLLVAESGIRTAAEIRTLRDAGFDAFLIGESLMRAASPGAALQELLLACG